MDCDYFMFFVYWILVYVVIFLVMFVDFYRNVYKKLKINGVVINGVKVKVN